MGDAADNVIVEEPILDGVDAKELDTKTRDNLSNQQFAWPAGRKLPIHDAAHVRNALARFNQTQGMSPSEKKTAWARIKRAAKRFGIEVRAEMDSAADAFLAEADDGTEIHATAWLMAAGIDLPHVADHPNRMPFEGILTRIGVPSDRPPHGALGKRVLLTHAAAEEALDSLIGMAVDLTDDFAGHNVTKKVGIITSAHIDGDALRIAGIIYAADFPREALRIHLDHADLGFSFEAQKLRVESLDADPLVIKSCTFTGAAILLKNQAAYETTALAAARAKEYEMSEISDAVQAAVAAALGSVSQKLEEVATAQQAQAQRLEELQRAPAHIQANAAMLARVEPHASRLEAAADMMQAAGVGLHMPFGHADHLRRMAHSMRADAAVGKVPHEFHDAAFAATYPFLGAAAPALQAAASPAPAPALKIEDSPEFRAMKASFEAQIERAKEDGSVLKTQMADLQHQLATLRPGPTRKTITPEIQTLLARAGVAMPDMGDDGTISVAKIDAALANTNLNTSQRLHIKTALARGGVIPNGYPVQQAN